MEESKALTTPEFKKKLASLYAYLAAHLQLHETPDLKFVTNKKNSNDILGLTAYYDQVNREITVYITNRHPKDILRSFAHEVIHHWQNERGTLHSHLNDPQYAQNDPALRKSEMQAYLLGNILFRDWSDIYKHGNKDVHKSNSTNPRQ